MADRTASLDDALEALRDRGIDPESAGGAVALTHLLSEAPAPSSPQAVTPTGALVPVGNAGESATALAEWGGVSRDEILDIFEFDDESIGIGLSSGRLPSSKAECQRALVVLKLAAERIAGGREVVPASEINEIVSHYGVFDQNLASNVSIKTNMVARRGKRGSWKYRITQPGLDRARIMISTLAGGEDL
jgi:hypothetical protein